MKKIFLIYFCLLSGLLQAQRLEVIDSLTLDAEYEKASAMLDRLEPGTTEIKLAILNRKAAIALGQGKFSLARNLLEQARQLPAESRIERANTGNQLGLLCLAEGRRDEAFQILQETLEFLEANQMNRSLPIAQTYNYLGNVYSASGQYEAATQNLNQALSIRRSLLPANHELIAAIYNDLGLVLSQTNPEAALDNYEMAQQVYEKLHGKNHPKLAIALTNTAFIYSSLELFGDAIANYEAALTIWTSLYPGDHPAKAFVLYMLGQTTQKMQKNADARSYFQKSLLMYTSIYGDRHPDVSRVHNSLGLLDKAERKFPEALGHFQAALQANSPGIVQSAFNFNPPASAYYDPNVLLYSLLYKAETLESDYYNHSLRFQTLKSAFQTLQVCDTLIDRLRQQINNENDKLTLASLAADVYMDAVRISEELSQVAVKPSGWREQSFYFAEKSKSAVLLDAISDSQAKSFAGIPASVLAEESRLRAELASLTRELATRPGGSVEAEIRQQLFERSKAYQQFQSNLGRDYPSYYNLKFDRSAPTVAAITSRLDATTAVISYFQDEKNSRIYIYILTTKGLEIHHRTLPENINRVLTGFRNGIIYSAESAYIETASQLSSLLLPKLPRTISRLVIIPVGQFSLIPFEALFFEKPKTTGYATLPYLVKKYSIRYEFSAGLILQKQDKPLELRNALLCAPVTFEELPELPGTESEVMQLEKLFAVSMTTKSYLRNQADETSLKSGDLTGYDVIHLATHGIVDEKHPELSRIYFHPDKQNDGELFTGEVYNMRLNATLVTLSACQTGLGKISGAEGVMGLSRALKYAGARNSIVSYWSVSDASTSKLMIDFYTGLIGTNRATNLDQALQKAKVKMIDSPTFGAPFYWAPFILLGF